MFVNELGDGSKRKELKTSIQLRSRTWSCGLSRLWVGCTIIWNWKYKVCVFFLSKNDVPPADCTSIEQKMIESLGEAINNPPPGAWALTTSQYQIKRSSTSHYLHRILSLEIRHQKLLRLLRPHLRYQKVLPRQLQRQLRSQITSTDDNQSSQRELDSCDTRSNNFHQPTIMLLLTFAGPFYMIFSSSSSPTACTMHS